MVKKIGSNFMFEEDLEDINIEDLEEDDYELKFFIWSRKIEDEIQRLEEYEGKEAVRNYLEKCATLREKFLDPFDLEEIEEYYMEKIHEKWEEYGITDPIYERLKG